MTFISSWEEFTKAAERLYTADPMKVLYNMFTMLGPDCRFVIKYSHNKGYLTVKMTDDKVCLQYRTEHTQDVKKVEKFTGQLMRHMASKDLVHSK